MTTHTPYRCANSAMIQRGANEVVLMNTGSYPSFTNYLNQTNTWNGTDWTLSSALVMDAAGPLPGRTNTAMTYDGYNVVLFGGQGGPSVGYLNDTWSWSGTAWSLKTPTNAPFGRAKAEIAFLNGVGTIMFGGAGGSGSGVILNETWKWDGYGLTWTLLSPVNSPPARIDHCMAASTTKVLVFGGKGTNAQLNDTWTYSSGNWTQATPATSPSVRSGACMSYDTVNSIWVMFGGCNTYNYLPETWTYSGTVWNQVAVANGTGPAARVGAQMCFDAQSGKTLMFGGISAGDSYPSNATWAFDGAALTWAKL